MTRKPLASAKSQPQEERGFPYLSVMALAALVLLFAYDLKAGGEVVSETHAGLNEDAQRIVSISYHPDPREWPGRPPTLCEIADHYELGQHARAATLYLNRVDSGCAPGDWRVTIGEPISLALWAPPDFGYCLREAGSCR